MAISGTNLQSKQRALVAISGTNLQPEQRALTSLSETYLNPEQRFMELTFSLNIETLSNVDMWN